MENNINLHYTHKSEWKRSAVPCGRAGSAANMHYDQDILTSAVVLKIIPRFPFSVRIGFLCMLILPGKNRVKRASGGSKSAPKIAHLLDPLLGTFWTILGVDLPGKTRCFLHADVKNPGFFAI